MITDARDLQASADAAAHTVVGTSTENGQRTITSSAFASIERERVEWLLPGRVPLGMLSLLLGDPGLGKSLFTCWLAGEVSRAGFDVLMCTAEDSPGATVRPRLEAVQADLRRVHLVEMRHEGFTEGIELPDDVAALDALTAKHKARLVVIDPLMAHLPATVNSWRDQSVRSALAPLARMAAERRCAAVVVGHLTKAKGGEALYRAGGSIGIPAAARSALLLARDPNDPDGERGTQRVVAHIKCNVAPLAESQSAVVEPILLDEPGRVETARISITGSSTVTASELLNTPATEERTERDEAVEHLRGLLADGPVAVKEIKADATAAGLAWRTIERAKAQLGVKAERQSMGAGGAGRWLWQLPDQDRHEQDRQPYISPPGGLGGLAVLERGNAPLDHPQNTQDRQPEQMATLDAPRATALPFALDSLSPPNGAPRCSCERPTLDSERRCVKCGRHRPGDALTADVYGDGDS